MNLEHYLAFIAITVILFLSPGPSVILIINNGFKYGFKLAAIGVLGNVVAFQFLMIISATGLGAILAASKDFFIILKVLGATYLIYLGCKLWLSSVPDKIKNNSTSFALRSRSELFKEALLVTITNPKALVFVSALLPQFINVERALLTQIMLLCITTAIIHFGVYLIYAMLTSRVNHLLENSTNRKIFNKLSGSIFIFFAIALGLTENDS